MEEPQTTVGGGDQDKAVDASTPERGIRKAIYCRGCRYPLRGLVTSKCPECGRDFDPSDSKTFRSSPESPAMKQLLRYAAPIAATVGVLGISEGGFDVEKLIAAITIQGLYATAALIASTLVIFFGWKRAKWEAWEALIFVLPFQAWAFLMFTYGDGKSLSNLFGEWFLIAVVTPIPVLVRVMVGKPKNYAVVTWVLIIAMCGVAIARYYLTPGWPE